MNNPSYYQAWYEGEDNGGNPFADFSIGERQRRGSRPPQRVYDVAAALDRAIAHLLSNASGSEGGRV